MKRFTIPVLILFSFAALSLIAGLIWWKINTSSVSDSGEKIEVVIPKGRSAEQIAEILYENKLIKSTLAFKIYVQFYDKQNSLKAGEFQLSPNMNLSELLDSMGGGPSQVWVTIQEGLRREEYPDKFIEGLGLNTSEAITFRSEFLSLTADKEGYLFPDTYLLPPDINTEKVVNLLLSTFEKRYNSIDSSSTLTRAEVVSLASILERETRTKAERPMVAGIYFNRLDAGMPLQTDASVQYVLGTSNCTGKAECNWWPTINRTHYELDSPYNTYQNTGIPPKPISNPGLSSLEAVLNPSDNSFYYYVHDDSGNVYYAETLDEHNANVTRYLR